MASSVARMPTDDWRDSGLLSAAGVFARPHLRKALVRNVSLSTANSSSNSSTTTNNLRPVPKDVGSVRKSMDEESTSAGAADEEAAAAVQKRRQPQFLDRWGARRAKEMVTTIERQIYEAEVSAQATRTQPVSSRAATFLREASPASSEASISAARTPMVPCRAPSPALSDCSFLSAPATLPCSVSGSSNSFGIDLPPNVRASSLIQMWRELEAEACVTPVVRSTSCGSCGFDNLEPNNPTAFPAENSSGNLDNLDEPETFADVETEITMRTIASTTSAEPAVANSSINESETSKVGIIVKMLTSGYESTSTSTWLSPIRKKPVLPDWRNCEGIPALSGLTLKRVRGRKELEGLAMRREQERRREIQALADSQHVSRFCYRGRLQSMLRLRSLRRQFAVREQMRASSSLHDINLSSSNWSTFSLFRQKFEYASEPSDNNSKRETERSSCMPVQIPDYSQSPGYIRSVNEFVGDSVRFTDVPSSRGSESPPNADISPVLDDPPESFNSPDGSWDERSLWVRNRDWQRNIESSPSNAWHGDNIIEESDSYSELNARDRIGACIGESPNNSWRGWDASRNSNFPESIRSYSDNTEIRELLERRAVSTSLASDFSDKMNRIILTYLDRQGSHHLEGNHSGNYYEDQLVQRGELDHFDQLESVSSSLVPLTYCQNERCLPSFLTSQKSHNLTEMDDMHDLRTEMQQIRQDIRELKSMVQGCMQWQEQFQHSMKQDILDAIRQAGCLIIPNENGVDRTLHTSNPTQGRKGNCCICNEMKIDSLLYRCGHMCTCYKCACELQWNSSRCPICRSPIVDVVRAYPNT